MSNKLLKKLILSFKKQNMEVFPVIYEEFKKLITIYSYRIGGEDAYQELTLFFIELLYTVDTDKFLSDDTNGLSKYIAVAVRNKYIDMSKESSKYRSAVLGLYDNYNFCGGQNMSYSDFETLEMLNGLSNRQRAVIIYKYIYKYSDIEISEMLGISRQAVNRLKNRALKQLRVIL